jgi:hypothetical protein
MTNPAPHTPRPPAGDEQPGLFKRYPKLSILLIAGVFYAILIGMFLFVMVLIIRG